MEKSFLDMLWVVVSAGLVFIMQGGFLCLETGLTRSKNNINVALKNLADFGFATILFWAFGYALMFGSSYNGWIGHDSFLLDFGQNEVWLAVFFFFQLMFCSTAVTILSGAVAERMRFGSYLLVAAFVSALIYPMFGHWAWNGINTGAATGWLAAAGFVDFAGSTVVHSVGGWAALAILLLIGPRSGRFPADGPARKIPGANIPLATLGVILLWLGWFGFNGGSTLAMNDQVAVVLGNTVLAGGAGLVSALGLGWLIRNRADVDLVLNGSLAGLVAVTANAHAVSSASAVAIGAVGGAVMFAASELLERYHIDDAVGAIPVHLGAGVWGTLAVALFGKPELLGTGLAFWPQLQMQLLGIVTCAVWTFSITYLIFWTTNRLTPLRVSAEDEYIGLNISEHGASTELLDLFTAMDEQSKTGNLSLRVPVEPFTEIGQIAQRYNQVMDALEQAVARTEVIVKSARDGIITFSKNGFQITSPLNPAAETMFGYQQTQLWNKPLDFLLVADENSNNTGPVQQAITALSDNHYQQTIGRRADGSVFPLEFTVAEAAVAGEPFYIGTFRDITRRKKNEAELTRYREHLEEQVEVRTAELSKINMQLQREILERRRTEETLRVTQFSVDNAADAVLWVSATAKFLYANNAACQLLGYTHAELLTMTYYDIDKNHTDDTWSAHWERTQQAALTEESRFKTSSGQIFPVEVTFTYLEFGDNTYNFVFARDITRRLWTLQALRQSEERFRHVIASISDHIYVTEFDAAGQPKNRYISPNVQALTGYPAKTIIDDWRFWSATLIHPEDLGLAQEQLEKIKAGHNSETEYRLVTADQKTIWVRDSAQVEQDPIDGVITAYGVVSNITERKNAQQALGKAFNQVAEASHLKSQLLANVSHDMRTPLGSILGYTEMIQAGVFGDVQPKQGEALTEIIDSTEQLLNFLNNLLGQAQIESGKIILNPKPFTPDQLLESIQSAAQALALAKGLTIQQTIDPALPPHLTGDLYWLRQILVNLVSNAVKFTEQGKIEVNLFKANADHWAMQVSDTGCGIAPKNQQLVFEAFRQVDETTARKQNTGSGLGLSIVQELATMMAGKVTLESTPDQGSTFTVILPLQPVTEGT